ncbi:MAG: hypothetical protein KDI50_07175, partial [Candidatus Competibacteraceae bacterium]|nr:hypothetical protein [Candidatus Competibacteraceae bacterium]
MDTRIAEAGDSYALKEEAQLAQIWNVPDQTEHERALQEITQRFSEARRHFEEIRVRVDTAWEQFITLTLERIFSDHLREFIDKIGE